MKRIRRLLYPRTSGAWAPFVAVLILVLTAVATVAAWPAQPSQSNAGERQPQTERSLDPVYSKWLNEDVAYIIDQAERSAFLGLTTNENATSSSNSSGNAAIRPLARPISLKKNTTDALPMPISTSPPGFPAGRQTEAMFTSCMDRLTK
jgi:hypothetical protein